MTSEWNYDARRIDRLRKIVPIEEHEALGIQPFDILIKTLEENINFLDKVTTGGFDNQKRLIENLELKIKESKDNLFAICDVLREIQKDRITLSEILADCKTPDEMFKAVKIDFLKDFRKTELQKFLDSQATL